MFKKFGAKFGSKMDLNSTYQCTIRFLDDAEPLKVTYQGNALGQWMLDHVARELNLLEKDYFGLRYIDVDKQRHWLDPSKAICKQLKSVNPAVLCFRVKFYPADPMKLQEELTRYNLFLQLRRDLHHGRLLCSQSDANFLAACIVQSEVGDYDPEVHKPGYISEFKMLPKQTESMEDKIIEIHKTLKKKVPSEAENDFITKAICLETYGVDPHTVKDQKGNQMFLGVNYIGVVTLQGSKRTHLFTWDVVDKISFEGKMFILHVTLGDSDGTSPRSARKHTVGFKCQNVAACRHLWKCAAEQQAFYTLTNASSAKKLRSGRGLFRRGSTYSFGGRSQREVLSDSIKRAPPPFISCLVGGTGEQHDLQPINPNDMVIPEENEITLAEGSTYSPDETSEVTTPEPPSEPSFTQHEKEDVIKDIKPMENGVDNMYRSPGIESEATTTASDPDAFTDSLETDEYKPTHVEGMSCSTALCISLLLTTMMCLLVYAVFEADLQAKFVSEVIALRTVYYEPAKEYVKSKISTLFS